MIGLFDGNVYFFVRTLPTGYTFLIGAIFEKLRVSPYFFQNFFGWRKSTHSRQIQGAEGRRAAVPRKPKEQLEDGRVLRYDTIKARLYPNEAQAELFEKTFGCCRYIWNRMLADQQRFYIEADAHFIPTPAKYKKRPRSSPRWIIRP